MTIKNKVLEYKLQAFCEAHFKRQGYLTRVEVPFLFKVADLVCFSGETGECVAIEVKIRRWKEALSQALVYQMMADRVYIALFEEYIKSVQLDVLLAKGVGLLSVHESGEVSIIAKAPKSPRRDSFFVSTVIANVFSDAASPGCLMI